MSRISISTEITPQELRTAIIRLWRVWRGPPPYALLILGPPGVGKSTTVRQAAEEIARTMGLPFVDTAALDKSDAERLLQERDAAFLFTDIRLTYHEPSDLIGIPRSSHGGATVFEPPLHILLHTRHPGVLFFDEVTAVQRDDVIATMLQITLDRQVGYTRLHQKTLVILAGNDVADTSLARTLPRPLINRTMILRVRSPSVQDWINYMSQRHGDGWDIRVAAFLRRFPEYLHAASAEEENAAFPTPRTWEWIAVQLYNDPDTPYFMIAGLLGEEVAAKLAAYLNTQVDIKGLLREPELWRQLNLDQKTLAASLLTREVDVFKQFDQVEQLLRVIAEDSIEYVALIIMSLERSERRQFIELLRRHMPQIASKLIELGLKIASFR